MCGHRGSRDLAKKHCHWLVEEMDLSYLNGPDIAAMLYEAGFQGGVSEYVNFWTILQPPQECIDLLFVNKQGQPMWKVVEALIEVRWLLKVVRALEPGLV